MKNPVSAELMRIYLNTFPWPTTLCFYGYRNLTRSKITGNFLVNAFNAFQRFKRRYHVKINNYNFQFIFCTFPSVKAPAGKGVGLSGVNTELRFVEIDDYFACGRLWPDLMI